MDSNLDFFIASLVIFFIPIWVPIALLLWCLLGIGVLVFIAVEKTLILFKWRTP